MTTQGHAPQPEWGPWVLHDGRGCPLPPGTIVEVVSQDGFGFTSRATATVTGGAYSSWNWEFYPELMRILRYRVRKPRGLQMLESRLRALDAPSRTTVPSQG